jgi:carbamoyl-phosphate synthase small subunit
LRQSALLALADGTLFRGESIGSEGQTVGEVVFNTALTGYQEIVSDPSYTRQIVTLTYPHIGNTGINPEDEEGAGVMAAGLVIRDLPLVASNWRSQETLEQYLRRHKVVGIAGLDTRKLTRILREKGAQNGCLVAGDNIDAEAALAAARGFAGLNGMDLAKEVTTRVPFEWAQGSWTLEGGLPTHPEPLEEKLPLHVVVYDYGVKRNILRMLVDRGCRLTVVPAQMPAEQVLAMKPDGVVLANGPGDPAACDYAIESIQRLLKTEVPLFGICLGHQLLSLASGARTVKM